MQSTGLVIGRPSYATAAAILFDIVVAAKNPKRNKFNRCRGSVSSRRRWRCRTLWCLFKLFTTIKRQWQFVHIRSKVGELYYLFVTFQVTQLFLQRIEFPSAQWRYETDHFNWSRNRDRSVPIVLATLGLVETGKSWNWGIWKNKCLDNKCGKINRLWKRSFQKFGCSLDVERDRWTCMPTRSNNF